MLFKNGSGSTSPYECAVNVHLNHSLKEQEAKPNLC